MVDKWLLRLVYEYQGFGITLYVLLTTLLAALFATLIGVERQLKGEAAGIRTHALLAIASSLLMTISIWAIRSADGTIDIITGQITTNLDYDTSRIAAGVVTGIGFLGGGVIIRDKFTVRGLSTAASLLICAAIGLACGAGFVLEAGVSTLVVLLVLNGYEKILEYWDSRRPTVTISCSPDCPVLEIVRDFSEKHGISLKHADVISVTEDHIVARAFFDFSVPDPQLEYACLHLKEDARIHSAEVSTKNRLSQNRDLE